MAKKAQHAVQRAKSGSFGKTMLVIFLVVLALAGLVWLFAGKSILTFISEKKAEIAAREAEISAVLDIGDDRFYSGIYVDGIDIGGLTVKEARAVLKQLHKEEIDAIGVTVKLDWKTITRFDADNVTVNDTTDEVLEKALTVGRSGYREVDYEKVKSLAENPVYFTTSRTVDPAPLEECIRGLAEYLSCDPVEAYVGEFNPSADQTKGEMVFEIREEEDGMEVDADELWSLAAKEILTKNYGTVKVPYTTLKPTVTTDMIAGDVQLIAQIETDMADIENRIHNVKKACESINGVILQPGETFSYNDCLGPRTLATGYLEAGIISSGAADTGVGGGICQVSSMLYNAALRAECEILERYHHSYPLSYLPAGTDATVDYGKLDLRFTNTRSTPIYIVAYVEGLHITVQMYGTPREDGLTVDILSKITRTKDPGDTIYIQDSSVPKGSQVVYAGHEGKTVRVYRIYLDADGNEVEDMRELLYTDVYDPIQRRVRVNPEDYEGEESND